MSYLHETFGVPVDRHTIDLMDVAAAISAEQDGGGLYGGLVELFVSWAPYYADEMQDTWDTRKPDSARTWATTDIYTQARYLLAHARDCAERAIADLPDWTDGWDELLPDPSAVLKPKEG